MSAHTPPFKSRFCPSPTGLMHLGNARTALFSYLLAHSPTFKDKLGRFLLRIEDTDRARSTVKFSEYLMDDLKWLGLHWDEGPDYQSERTQIYNRYYQQLMDQGEAYYCFCTEVELQLARRQCMQSGKAPRYPGTCRHLDPDQIQEKLAKGLKPAIRYQIKGNQTIEFCDLIQGPKCFQSQDIGDFIIKKNDDSASFMFCNAIDDSLMGVTHVLRGEDHLTNTPRQLMILRALGLAEPLYGHLPLIVGHDGKPLSKRNGSLSVQELKEQGFLPLAVVNYLARLGHHFEDTQFAPLSQLAEHFSLKQISRSPARFDYSQLLYWQKEALSKMTEAQLIEWMSDCSYHTPQFVRMIRDNITCYKDVEFWAEHFRTPIHYASLPQKDYIIQAGAAYFQIAKDWIQEKGLHKAALFDRLKKELNLKGPALFMPMRLAVSGVNFGPELDKIFEFLGAEKVIQKLDQVLAFIAQPQKAGLRLYNSISKQKEVFKPLIPGKISLYVCGITVYDDCHLGHARVFVVFDMMVRFLKRQGWEVTYVRNITDIDDKIIRRAVENQESITDLTERYIKSMDEDSAQLGVLKPNQEPRATQYIAQMLDLIQKLVDKNIAYVGDNQDVYFSVEHFPAYGELAHRTLEKLHSGARVDIDLAKRNPLDFVLWKPSKENEPAWPSPWGEGRPGWHIECSAMAMNCLGPSIDIHGGGSDLKFPHHENERAQSEGATDCRFVNTWMHVGFVQIDKEKMSKSLGNFFTIKSLLAEYEGEVIRYLLLSSHYRSPLNYSQEALEFAKGALTTLYTALRGVNLSEHFINLNSEISDYETRFIEAMEDDFNTPEAFVVLFELARDLNIAKTEQPDRVIYLASILKTLGNSLGFLEKDPDAFLQGGASHNAGEIDALIEERRLARQARNWARADEIRQLLESKNIVIEDTPEGTLWRHK